MNIAVTQGAHEYVAVTLTEVNGETINASRVEIGLRSRTGTLWGDALVTGTGAKLTAKRMIDSATPVAQYSVWVRITTGDEEIVMQVGDVDTFVRVS